MKSSQNKNIRETVTNTQRIYFQTLQWRHNGYDGVSNHQPHDCLVNRLFRRRSKKTSMLRAIGLCAGIHRKMFPFDDVIMNIFEIAMWFRLYHGKNFHCFIAELIFLLINNNKLRPNNARGCARKSTVQWTSFRDRHHWIRFYQHLAYSLIYSYNTGVKC